MSAGLFFRYSVLVILKKGIDGEVALSIESASPPVVAGSARFASMDFLARRLKGEAAGSSPPSQQGKYAKVTTSDISAFTIADEEDVTMYAATAKLPPHAAQLSVVRFVAPPQ